MSYLVDTNVLLRSVQISHPMHSDAAGAIVQFLRGGEAVSIVAQNLIEFWAVATRPEAGNGLALSLNQTAQIMAAFKSTFFLLPDTSSIFAEWERLVARHRVAGKQVYARLVAAMNVHQVTHLLTFNTDDFKRYHEITVISPASVQ